MWGCLLMRLFTCATTAYYAIMTPVHAVRTSACMPSDWLKRCAGESCNYLQYSVSIKSHSLPNRVFSSIAQGRANRSDSWRLDRLHSKRSLALEIMPQRPRSELPRGTDTLGSLVACSYKTISMSTSTLNSSGSTPTIPSSISDD